MHRLFFRGPWLLAVLVLFVPLAALAHVTPDVTLVKRGDFVKEALPGAVKFFEKSLNPAAAASVREATGWTRTQEESKVYVGRDERGNLVGSVVFLRVPSQHGPVGLGVAFGPAGEILQATVTDVGTEPLVWVRPLLREGLLRGVEGLGHAKRPDPDRIATGASGQMSRYYVRVIADGIWRAERIEEAALPPLR